MSDFNLVWAEFWPEARAKSWTDDMDKLALYLLTCEHRQLAGLYRLPLPYAGADLGWIPERVELALDQLILDGFAAYDDNAQVVMVCSTLKRQAPKSEKHITGAVNSLKKLPETALLLTLLAAAETHSEGFAIAIREGFPSLSDGVNSVGIRRPETHSNHAHVRTDPRPHTREEDKDNNGSSSNVPALRLSGRSSNVVGIEHSTTSGEAA